MDEIVSELHTTNELLTVIMVVLILMLVFKKMG